MKDSMDILELRWAQFVDQGQHFDAASLNEGGSWSNYPFPHWRKEAIMGRVHFEPLALQLSWSRV